MNMEVIDRDEVPLFVLHGRLDAHAAKGLEEALESRLTDDGSIVAILDCQEVNYLSSAGIRVLLSWHKRLAAREGMLGIVGIQGYCRDVLDMTGFADALAQFDSLDRAWRQARCLLREKMALSNWGQLETRKNPHGEYRFIPGDPGPTVVEILGDVREVLHASITADKIFSKKFFDTEYSIGMGGLGGDLDDYLPVLGEMITVGGAMVWLPTDGHDTADFLIPKADRGAVLIRTGFNVSIKGMPSENIYFVSHESGGTSIGALYRSLFAFARERRKDYRGALGVVMRANMPAVFGSGIKKSAIRAHRPANGKMIIHESNMTDWFDHDRVPRHKDVTALMVGLGADLTYDLSDYDEEDFNRVFYLHPVNIGAKQELLHNHGVLFNECPMPEKPVDLDKEVRAVIEHNDFLDMRHLLDSSTVSRAFLSVYYIQEFRSDKDALLAERADSETPVPEFVKNRMKYYTG